MQQAQMVEILKKAINSQTKLLIKTKYGLGEQSIQIEFDPYLYGSDKMQYDFLFGFLSISGQPHTLRLDDIISVSLKSEKFKVEEWVYFYYALEQELYAVAPEFDGHIYNGSHIGDPILGIYKNPSN